jgi:hypothetical protein
MKDYGEARREFWGLAACTALTQWAGGGDDEAQAKHCAEQADAMLVEWERRWTVPIHEA